MTRVKFVYFIVTASIESERSTKMKSKAGVNEVHVSEKSFSKSEKNKKDSNENAIMVEISKLNAKVNELAAIREELQDVKKQLAETSSRKEEHARSDSDRRWRSFKC